jgi:3-oxoacyl-[acyl-carrier protein] reductase
VLVTGASGGLGGGIAARLVEDGWSVALHAYSNPDTVRAKHGRPLGRDSRLYVADLSVESAVKSLFDELVRDYGRLDAIVSNHGIYPRSLIVEMSADEWDRVLAVNLRSTFLVCRAAVTQFRRQGSGGRIVTVASGAASRGQARGAHYAASKAAIIAFTKTLARELAEDGIIANCVAPGTVLTSMPRQENTDQEIMERAKMLVPLGRIGQPEDIAEVVCFLLAERLTWVTGQTIWVNGGDLML